MSTSSYELLHEAIERRLDHLQILMTCCTSTTGPDLKPLAGSGRLEVQLDQAERRLHHLNDLIQSQDRYIQRLRQIRSVLGHDDRPDGGELKKLGSTAAVVISAADFAKLPADRRRMTTSFELNQFYNRLQGRLRNKYDLLLKPRSALTSQELIEAVRYERQEQLPMTRGHRFLCMDDDPDADRTGALIEALIDLGTVHRIPGTSPACYTLIRLESA